MSPGPVVDETSAADRAGIHHPWARSPLPKSAWRPTVCPTLANAEFVGDTSTRFDRVIAARQLFRRCNCRSFPLVIAVRALGRCEFPGSWRSRGTDKPPARRCAAVAISHFGWTSSTFEQGRHRCGRRSAGADAAPVQHSAVARRPAVWPDREGEANLMGVNLAMHDDQACRSLPYSAARNLGDGWPVRRADPIPGAPIRFGEAARERVSRRFTRRSL